MSSTENSNTPETSEEKLADMGGVEIVYTPVDDYLIPANVTKNLAPEADNSRRLLLARNLVPLPPADMAMTLYCLMNDSVPDIRDAAEDSFDDLPVNIIKMIAGQKVPWQLLDYVVRNFYSEADPDQILETVIHNQATGSETLLMLIRVSSPEIIDLIANNQSRLQRTPQLIFEFSKNKRITIAQLSRVLEFARRQKLITPEQENRLIDEYLGKTQPEVKDVKAEDVVKQVITDDGEIDWEFPSFMTADFEADAGFDADAAIIEEKISNKMNMRELVRTMSVPEKIRLAIRGNMEARKILIDDPLALIAKEVLNNPRLTKTEVERIAASKLVDTEVLEVIAKSGSFLRTYAVKHSLVTNPKTPLQYASKLLHTLQEKDIKAISKSKSVSGAIQSIARQKMDAQEQRRKKRQKKKK